MRIAAAAALLMIATALNAADQTLKTAAIYDGAAFDDIAGGIRRGGTYFGTLRLQLTFARRGLQFLSRG